MLIQKTQIKTIASLCLMIAANNVMARQLFVEPEIFVSGGYEDNPNLESDLELEDIEVSPETERIGGSNLGYFSGSFRLGSESESDLIAFDLSAAGRRYSDSILNTDYWRGSFLYYKTGQVNDWGIDTGYIESTSITDFIGDPGGGTAVDDFGRFRGDTDTNRYYFHPYLTSRFSASWIGELAFEYNDVGYDEPIDLSDEFEEYRIRAELRRILTERVSLSAFTNLVFYRPTESIGFGDVEEENAADLQLGIDYLVSERLSIFFSAGLGYIESTLSDTEGAIEITDTEPAYSTTVEYAGLRNIVSFGIASGYESLLGAGLSSTERFTLDYRRLETLGGELSITASFLDRAPALGESIEEEFYVLTPSISWAINSYLSLSINVQYRAQEISDTVSGETDSADSTAYVLGVSYDWGRKLLKN